MARSVMMVMRLNKMARIAHNKIVALEVLSPMRGLVYFLLATMAS